MVEHHVALGLVAVPKHHRHPVRPSELDGAPHALLAVNAHGLDLQATTLPMHREAVLCPCDSDYARTDSCAAMGSHRAQHA